MLQTVFKVCTSAIYNRRGLDIELLAIWDEFLGGIGVIISLIFLGMQTLRRIVYRSQRRSGNKGTFGRI